ncbi:MAG: hypothetical protein ABW022_23990 [Actinoplanes sp.]
MLPFVAFVLWEFPSMVAMSLHKAICALLGRSLADDFLGIWGYRMIGVLVLWPVTFIIALLAISGGFLGTVGQMLLAFEVLSVGVLLVWARVSQRGA